jgi:hypothetical protein
MSVKAPEHDPVSRHIEGHRPDCFNRDRREWPQANILIIAGRLGIKQ